MRDPIHAVVPAAGRGTRLGSLTDETPKPLVEIAGQPLLAHVFDALAPFDPETYVVVIGYQGEQIRDRFSHTYSGTTIEYVRQPDPIGLADAVRCAGEAIRGDPFVVCNGDNVFRSDLTGLTRPLLFSAPASSGKSSTAATMLVERTTPAEASETGVVVTDDTGEVQRVVEKPEHPPSTLVSAGAYAFSPVILDACAAIEPGATGEYELADAITWLLDRGYRVETVEFDGERVNVNERGDLERAEELLEA